ncbi:hypothetical protein [Pyxidicoccus sp. MSG2]|uniref:hypothetical protein n=1 Tax=Pyxidicoccus sp. MSG2 TaxID=2996790 RepID=UPI00226F4952|nr:hypothetical protein [Pyxidicoccus sp. MSG2]MCY1017005.1 hypothetical protein [Pyxidicoccus sp. MSG2]
MKKTHGFVSKSVVALAMLSALPAAAGTASYPGSLCTSVSGFGAPTIFRSGRLLNQSASAIEVVCPIQRNILSPYTEDMSLTVTVSDPHLTADVCCTGYVADNDGSTLAYDEACTPAGTADITNPRLLSINLPAVNATYNGYLSLRCELPAQSTTAGVKYSSVLASFVVYE